LYELVLGPIRTKKPVITEMSVSPLRSGSTPGRKSLEYTPDFSFIQSHDISFAKDEPLRIANPKKAMNIFLDGCGVKNAEIRSSLLDIAGKPQGKPAFLLVAKLFAHIVGKTGALPLHCTHALVYQCSILLNKKFVFKDFLPKKIPVNMAHVNAASTFSRVFTYVKALNIVCGCPIKNMNRLFFMEGKVFHHVCNLLLTGDFSEIRNYDETTFLQVQKWCNTYLNWPEPLARIPEVVEDMNAIESEKVHDVTEEEGEKEEEEVEKDDDNGDDDDDEKGEEKEKEKEKDDDTQDKCIKVADLEKEKDKNVMIRKVIERAKKEPLNGLGQTRVFRIVNFGLETFRVPVTYTNGMAIP